MKCSAARKVSCDAAPTIYTEASKNIDLLLDPHMFALMLTSCDTEVIELGDLDQKMFSFKQMDLRATAIDIRTRLFPLHLEVQDCILFFLAKTRFVQSVRRKAVAWLNSENQMCASGSKVVIKYIAEDGKVGPNLDRFEGFEHKIDCQVLSLPPLISLPCALLSSHSPVLSYHLTPLCSGGSLQLLQDGAGNGSQGIVREHGRD